MKIVDMHCDTISVLLDRNREGKTEHLRQNSFHVDLERMKSGGYLLQNFALFVDKENGRSPWQEVMAMLEIFEQEMRDNQELILPVRTYDDIVSNEKQGKLSALLTVEEGAVCCGELEKLRLLYDRGVRMMTFTWNYPNELGYPNLNSETGRKAWGQNRILKEACLSKEAYTERQAQVDRMLKDYLNTPDTEHGLTQRGREFAEEMEHLGMIPDVSHLSDAGFYDMLEVVKKPFVASHSNARAICPCARNLTDDMIRRLAQRGGVTGLNYCSDFLTETPAGESNPGTVESVVAHAIHIVKVGGIGCLGLGSDFDGIDTHEELPGVQSMSKLWDGLKKGGFKESEIDAIFGENVLRLYREWL